jgi:hypothetical protein
MEWTSNARFFKYKTFNLIPLQMTFESSAIRLMLTV